jgi:siroheme synthase-like protein
MRYAYPMMLDVTDRLAVIVGGGTVAVRKAKGLLGAGARAVRVVSPEFHPDMPADVDRVKAEYAPGHLDGAGLAFAASDVPAVNAAVVRDARAMGVLVARADSVDDYDDEAGDFSTPARFEAGAVIVAVSAAGSPALAARIRDGLGDRFDPGWAKMADAMLTLRPLIRHSPRLDAGRRATVFRDLASPEALAAAVAGGRRGVVEWLSRRYPELRDLER